MDAAHARSPQTSAKSTGNTGYVSLSEYLLCILLYHSGCRSFADAIAAYLCRQQFFNVRYDLEAASDIWTEDADY
ncbi:MAG: hypothetical protein F6J95_003390 [Leptolyngbya sp. SIO1E4]|nr:hypothetical protein [Leptolyngbya sp. SIO1E4]